MKEGGLGDPGLNEEFSAFPRRKRRGKKDDPPGGRGFSCWFGWERYGNVVFRRL